MAIKTKTLILVIILSFSSFFYSGSIIHDISKSPNSITNGNQPKFNPNNLATLNNIANSNSTNFNVNQNIKTNTVSSAIETNSIMTALHSPGRDSYIVDFGFHQLFNYFASQVPINSPLGHVDFNETAMFSVDLTIPVNFTLVYNENVSAGNSANVAVNLYKVPTGASFSVSYGFTLGGHYSIGLSNLNSFELFNYTNTYQVLTFPVPLDPTALTTLAIPLPLYLIPGIGQVISSLFGIDLSLTPQIDVDLSTNLFFNGLGQTNLNSLTFTTQQQKLFSVDTSSLGSGNNVKFGLKDFAMNFFVSILWGLQVHFAGFLSILSFLGPLKIKLFTYPRVPIGGIATSDIAYGLLNITPTTFLPAFNINSYTLYDNGNGILQPGETVSVDVYLLNDGSTSAINANVTTSSSDVSLTSTPTSEYYLVSNGSTILNTISFQLSSSYTQRNVTINYDISSLSPNGTIVTSTDNLFLRVLQANDAYLNLNSWNIIEPNNGYWDAGEAINLNLSFAKVGTASITSASVSILGTDITGFTSTTLSDSITGSITTWTTSALELTSPVNVTVNSINVYLGVSYQLSTGQLYDDIWIITIPIYPLIAYEVLNQVYGTLNTGINDGIFQAGESFDMSADLYNLGDYASGTVYGYLTTNSSDVFISNSLLQWSSQNPGTGPSLSLNTEYLQISSHAKNETIILTLYIFYQTWWGQWIIQSYNVNLPIVAKPKPIINLNYYDVLDINTLASSSLAPNETSYIIVNLDIQQGPAFNVIGKLRTNDSSVLILNDTSYYGNLNPGATSNGDGFIVYIPANFKGGLVTFDLNVTGYSASGDKVSELAYFQIQIAAGDTIAPTFTINYPKTANIGDSVSINLNAQDNKQVGKIYFGFYNYSINDWTFMVYNGEVNPSISYSFKMSNQPFLFSFIIFDTAGNYIGGGLSTPLSINNPKPTSSSSTPINNNNPTTPISPTLKKSNTKSSPLTILPVFIGLLVPLVIISKRRKRYS